MRALLVLALVVCGCSGTRPGQVAMVEDGDAAATMQDAAALAESETALPPIPPPPPYRDARLREVTYDPSSVVRLAVASGRQMTLLFGDGEKIVSVAVGDSGAWQVTASRAGDSLFVKPVGAYSETNMTVITDSRVYLFDLVPGGPLDSVYLVRFVYPGRQALAVEEVPPIQSPGSYKLRGDKILRPDVIRDDGAKTYITWSAARAMPAVFAIAPSGDEMLVDGYVRNGEYTIDRVYRRLIFRFDQKTAWAIRE